MVTRSVLRIFISSTAIDLRDYRDRVRDTVLRLEGLPIAMETFSAQSGQPAAECMRMAAESDAVICIVAHRYGYIPPKELGGDGERSITWLEVDAAKTAGKPVFAFLVDPKAAWTEVKEQDRLTSEPSERIPEIVRAVQKLQEFKAYLERECSRNTFSSLEELAKLVAITVAKLSPDHAVSTSRLWRPLFCHALQPAQHFRGREERLQELKDWLGSAVTADRVVSVVAAGGTGKTAIVDRALHDVRFSDRSGVFVWSFYEDPNTDAFLRHAYCYFSGAKDAPVRGLLERLQVALSGDLPHVLILDGLERVQSVGGHKRRGELEDLELKRLVRSLAGGVGSARALVTSRFPLVDLDEWTGAGHRAILLDDLELPVALDVLRAWGVNGEDKKLKALIEPLNIGGFYHALSIAVLSSYLGNFPDGDLPLTEAFSLEDVQESNSKARRLSRILDHYSNVLTPIERDLLARLSLFPRGVKVELLGWIAQTGGEVAGALGSLAVPGLLHLLERLKGLGLVFRCTADGQTAYSAHPFLRDYFRKMLQTAPESVHESVRAQLALSLEARPSKRPIDPGILDQYEVLTEQTLLAGRIKEAFGLYWYGLGGYVNLGKAVGDSSRGLRIVERFCPQDDFSRFNDALPLSHQSELVNDFGLYAKNQGDLARARRAFEHCRHLEADARNQKGESVNARKLAEIELLAGRFRLALDHSKEAVGLAAEAKDEIEIKKSLAYRATSYSAVGDITLASADFQRATELEGKPLFMGRGIREAEYRLSRGDRRGALRQTLTNRTFAFGTGYNDDLCRCDALLARLHLPDNFAESARYLRCARAFADFSGEVELKLRCFHTACELHRHLGDYPQAAAEAEAGVVLADTCSFGKYSIELRIALAETHLAIGGIDDARKALRNARSALDRSMDADCQYAWGRADGLRLSGLAHLVLGEYDLGRQRLAAALELSEGLGHERIVETRRALAHCRPD